MKISEKNSSRVLIAPIQIALINACLSSENSVLRLSNAACILDVVAVCDARDCLKRNTFQMQQMDHFS
jgi:hypothetical protein